MSSQVSILDRKKISYKLSKVIVKLAVKFFGFINKLGILSDVIYELMIKDSKEDFLNPVDEKTGGGVLVVKIDDAVEMVEILNKINNIKKIQQVLSAMKSAVEEDEYEKEGTEMELDPEFEERLNGKKKEDLN